jgi:hypothetical protein
MKLRTFFVLDAVASALVAIGFLLGPATLLKFLGFSIGKTELLLGQLLGAALLGFAVLAWLAKDFVDVQSLRGIITALLTFSALGFVVTLIGIFSQAARAGAAWLLVTLFLLVGAGLGYFEFLGPGE